MSGPRRLVTVTATALLALAMASALMAWRGASGSSHPSDAISYLASGGLGGVYLAAVAVTLLATAHLDRTIAQLHSIRRNRTETCSSEQRG